MSRVTTDELKNRRLAAMSDEERVEFDQADEASRLAIEVGEKVRGSPAADPGRAAAAGGIDAQMVVRAQRWHEPMDEVTRQQPMPRVRGHPVLMR